MKRVPQFLDDIRLTSGDVSRLMPHMRNWLTVHAHLSTHHGDPGHLGVELKLMLLYELGDKRRPGILFRLYRKFAAVRRGIEEKQLFTDWR